MRAPFLYILAFLFSALQLAASVGVVSAVRGQAYIDRGGATIEAKVGTPVQRHDTVRTGKAARLQLLFNDKTVVTLGHSSRLRIEAYLYDGRDSKADLSMTRGFFRSVTGGIGKIAPQRFKLRTANATIGIRGTDILIDADPERGDTVACVLGRIVVTSLATHKSVEVDAGHSVTVKPDADPSAPKALDNGGMENLMQSQSAARSAAAAITRYRGDAYDERTEKIVEEETEESLPAPGGPPSSATGGASPNPGQPAAGGTQESVYDYDFVSLGFTRDSGGNPTGTWINTKDPTDRQVIESYRIQNRTADYRGNVVGIADGKAATGQMNMHFDFGQQKFDGTLDFKAEDGPRWIVYMKGEGDSDFKKDGTFRTNDVGDAAGTDVTIQKGNIKGAFYGPDAENIGGSFDITAEGGHSARGHFGGGH